MRRKVLKVVGILVVITGVVLLVALEPWVSGPKYRSTQRAEADRSAKKRGSVESVQHLHGYSKWELRALLLAARLPESVSIDNGIELYRIRYWTEFQSKPELVSALLAMPRKEKPLGTVAWSHGTSVERAFAPSTPTTEEGVLISAVYSGKRFVTVMPDLIGLGQSKSFHPYLHASSTIDTSIDGLRAAKTAVSGLGLKWQPNLFLSGFSQGGLTTALLQRTLEAKSDPNFSVKASAAMAPPLDLANISFPFAFDGKSSASSMYVGYVVQSFAKMYKQPANSVLKEEYASQLDKLYDGKHTSDQLQKLLPTDTRSLFQPSFLEGFERGDQSWLRDGLLESEGHQWAPKAPLRLFVGSKDVDVPPEDGRSSAKVMKAKGGNVTVVEVGPHDHEGVVLRAVPRSQDWFVALAKSRKSD